MTQPAPTTTVHRLCLSMGRHRLRLENRAYRDSGGRSQENRTAGFVPAFLDRLTGAAYRSRFADGRPAPIHLLEGLPADLLCRSPERDGESPAGCQLISGFLREGRFYTRAEAAAARQREAG